MGADWTPLVILDKALVEVCWPCFSKKDVHLKRPLEFYMFISEQLGSPPGAVAQPCIALW